MTASLHALFRSRQGWSNAERAQFARIERLLADSGLAVDIEHGQTDEGDPWCVFCARATGDVVIHAACIDGRFMIDSPMLPTPIEGRSFERCAERFFDDCRLPMALSDRRNAVMLHPSALLASLFLTILLYAQASSEQPLFASDATDADSENGDAEMAGKPAGLAPRLKAIAQQIADHAAGSDTAQAQAQAAQTAGSAAMSAIPAGMALAAIAIAEDLARAQAFALETDPAESEGGDLPETADAARVQAALVEAELRAEQERAADAPAEAARADGVEDTADAVAAAEEAVASAQGLAALIAGQAAEAADALLARLEPVADLAGAAAVDLADFDLGALDGIESLADLLAEDRGAAEGSPAGTDAPGRMAISFGSEGQSVVLAFGGAGEGASAAPAAPAALASDFVDFIAAVFEAVAASGRALAESAATEGGVEPVDLALPEPGEPDKLVTDLDEAPDWGREAFEPPAPRDVVLAGPPAPDAAPRSPTPPPAAAPAEPTAPTGLTYLSDLGRASDRELSEGVGGSARDAFDRFDSFVEMFEAAGIGVEDGSADHLTIIFGDLRSGDSLNANIRADSIRSLHLTIEETGDTVTFMAAAWDMDALLAG